MILCFQTYCNAVFAVHSGFILLFPFFFFFFFLSMKYRRKTKTETMVWGSDASPLSELSGRKRSMTKEMIESTKFLTISFCSVVKRNWSNIITEGVCDLCNLHRKPMIGSLYLNEWGRNS